jgi:hypothetical protein
MLIYMLILQIPQHGHACCLQYKVNFSWCSLQCSLLSKTYDGKFWYAAIGIVVWFREGFTKLYCLDVSILQNIIKDVKTSDIFNEIEQLLNEMIEIIGKIRQNRETNSCAVTEEKIVVDLRLTCMIVLLYLSYRCWLAPVNTCRVFLLLSLFVVRPNMCVGLMHTFWCWLHLSGIRSVLSVSQKKK